MTFQFLHHLLTHMRSAVTENNNFQCAGRRSIFINFLL